MSLLNWVNVSSGRSYGGFVLDFSIPQNYFGRFLSMSGSSNYKSARLVLHYYTKCFNALTVPAWFLPCASRARWKARRASRHESLNQGTSCLSHLFGFAKVLRLCFTSSTPAEVASASRNSSILVARRSLERQWASETAVKAVANSSVDVWAFQMEALAL